MHFPHHGIDLDTLPDSRLTLFHLSAKHLIPPKHPFAFSSTIFYLYMFTFYSTLLPSTFLLPFPFSLAYFLLHFMYIYVHIFIYIPTHLFLSLPLSSSWVAAYLFSPPIKKHSLSPSVTLSCRKMMLGEFVTLGKQLALIWSRQAGQAQDFRTKFKRRLPVTGHWQ